MKIYVAGPITGLPQLNYPAFNKAAALLRSQGHEVENPAENPAPQCGTWLGWMRLSVAQIARCEAIYLLPGWEWSRGALVEYNLAVGLGLQVLHAPAAQEVREEAPC